VAGQGARSPYAPAAAAAARRRRPRRRGAVPIVCDVTDETRAGEAVAEAADALGGIDDSCNPPA